MIAIVNQEAFLFPETIKENIAYGLPNASEAQVIKAARLANAHEFIIQLPNQYETIVGEWGSKLSVGRDSGLQLPGIIEKRQNPVA